MRLPSKLGKKYICTSEIAKFVRIYCVGANEKENWTGDFAPLGNSRAPIGKTIDFAKVLKTVSTEHRIGLYNIVYSGASIK
jgi:hypothetical protein